MKKVTLTGLLAVTVLVSCVSKKKYVALEGDLSDTKSALMKTQVEKEALESQMAKIEARVAEYNQKINSLQELNDSQLTPIEDVAVMSNITKKKMRATLAKVDPSELAKARTLEDSMNLAISYNLKKIHCRR